MKRYIVLIVLPVILLNCKNKDQGHIPPAVMQKVLLDMHMAETYSTISSKNVTNKIAIKNIDSLAVYYNDIFSHYNITPKEFDNSLKWYKNHPEDLDSVYNNMIPELNKLEIATAKGTTTK